MGIQPCKILDTKTRGSKNPGHQGSWELLWLAILSMCCHTSLPGDLSAAHMTPLVGTTGSFHLVSPELYPVHLLLTLICIFSL